MPQQRRLPILAAVAGMAVPALFYVGVIGGDAELMRDLNTRQDDVTPKVRPPPEQRELRLGGIVYDSRSDWTIWLNENSKLSYPENFDGDFRKVTLEGEAFFDVAKNPNQPFIIDVEAVDASLCALEDEIYFFTETSVGQGNYNRRW